MKDLDALSRKGAMNILRRLSTGEARFRELNEVVKNTRTLTRRLKELQGCRLIRKVGASYRITDEGFEKTFWVADVELRSKLKWVYDEGFKKIRYRWMKISLRRLVELFAKEFDGELISIVLYGSSIKDTFKLGRSDVDLLYILEDGVKNIWKREENIFRHFQSTWEYRTSDYLLKTRGFYGYPEVTTASINKSSAETFQPMYLDMIYHRTVLYDKKMFFENLMKKLQEALKALGTIRIEYADGAYCWLLKPDIAPGEKIRIRLR